MPNYISRLNTNVPTEKFPPFYPRPIGPIVGDWSINTKPMTIVWNRKSRTNPHVGNKDVTLPVITSEF